MTGWPDAARPASEVIAELGLQPLADEGGYWAPHRRTADGNAITFLMTPEGFSALHRLTVTECWTWLAGAPAVMLQLSDHIASIVLSRDNPGTLIPPDTWQGARTTGDWTLVCCWCLPAYTDGAFTLGERADLLAAHPAAADRIRELTR